MADYIHSNILCQAYLHVELADITEERVREILSSLDEYVQRRGAFFLYPEIEVDIRFKAGSLKAYLSIAGAIYIFLHQYGDFRKGVKLFYNDSKMLAESILSESLFITRTRHPQQKRTEARTGVLGSLNNIVSELDYVESHLGVTAGDDLAKHIKTARIESLRLLDVLRDPRDLDLTADHLNAFLSGLPNSPPPPPNKKVPRDAIVAYRSEIEVFIHELRRRKSRHRRSRGESTNDDDR
jgi:hypothetical protein